MQPNTAKSWLKRIAGQYSDKKAITFLRGNQVESEMTYSQLIDDVHRVANALLDHGVQKGDRVIIFLEKSLIAAMAHLALQMIGAISVPLNPGYKEHEMAYLLKDADPILIVSEPKKKAMLQNIDPDIDLLEISTQKPYEQIDFFQSAPATISDIEVNPDDPALIIYTSGTTGKPKGAVLTHRNLVHDASNIIEVWAITDNDVLCHALPLFHIHGLCFALHTALLSGAHVRLLDQFNPEKVVTMLSQKTGEDACSIFMAVPAMYTKMMDWIGEREFGFSHLRLMTSGSAPLPVSEFDRIKSVFGHAPVEREGMSETGMNFSNPVAGERKPGSIGLPLPGVAVRIVDPATLADIPPGEIGEIWLKSDSITPGYWRKPKETSEAFDSGWFKTGDLGRIDADDYYYLTDRIKHIIISGGENISAKEVETVINLVDEVVESAVVGLPDSKWGEKVAAAIALKPEARMTEERIKSFCKERLHDWKCPRQIIFVKKIPRNTMGKILKEDVKKMFVD